ncbi:MAG TPA: hypothetical protein VHM25_17240, partial [Polyangiaceae bacterium]|nr:hypothetical protein [Polyangiaceae bacterium]
MAQPPSAEPCAIEKLSPRAKVRSGFAARASAVLLLAGSVLFFSNACSTKSDGTSSQIGDRPPVNSGGSSAGGAPTSSGGTYSSGGSAIIVPNPANECPNKTCAALGWECGYAVDKCGNTLDCSKEGLSCSANQVCIGGVDGGPTKCVAGGGSACELCSAIPDCKKAGGEVTHLTGRVVTP